MRNVRNLLVFILYIVVLFFGSCDKEEPELKPELVVSTQQLTASKDGETLSFHIKSNIDWQISSSEPWCTISPSNGSAGTIKIEAIVQKNETTTPRTATLTISAGALSEQITVSQSESFVLTVSQDEFELDADETQITVAVVSSAAYTVNISEEWITKVTGSTSVAAKFQISEHPGLTERSANITFTLNNLTQVVKVIQKGKPLTIAPDNSGVPSDAMTLASKMGIGWNLGNSLEAVNVSNGQVSGNETVWGNPVTSKALIDAVKAAGFNAVRIPTAWNAYVADQQTFRIRESWINRVREVVEYCVDNGMYAVINIHWDGGWLENNPTYAQQEAVNRKQKALWEQIAVAFRDFDEHLLFAGTNEVHFDYNNPTAEHLAVQHSFNQTFVNAVRSTGGKNATRNLVVQAYNTNIGYAENFMTMPTDAGVSNRLMAEVHFYDPYDFTLDGSATSKYLWGAEFAGNPNRSTWGQEAWVDEAFAKMKTKFVNNGIPVILGEYGATLRSALPSPALENHIKARNHYFNYVNKAAKANGIIPFYWDNGNTGNNGSGLFNRNTGQPVHTDAIESIISAFE